MSQTEQEKFDAFIESPAVAAYVGKNWDHYKDVWSRQFAKKGSIEKMRGNILRGGFFSLNLPAIFFPVLWGFYRKSYKPAALLGLAMVLFSLVVLGGGFQAPGALYVMLMVFVGTMANAYYFDQVWDFMEEHKNLSESDRKQRAFHRGGTSIGYMIGGTLLYTILLSAILGVMNTILG